MPRPRKEGESIVRKSLEFAPSTIQSMNYLKEKLEADSEKETFKRAIKFMEMYFKDEEAGRKWGYIEDGKVVQLIVK